MESKIKMKQTSTVEDHALPALMFQLVSVTSEEHIVLEMVIDVTLRNLRKSERHIKELTFASDEDRKNHERMQILIDQLQGKIKAYKKQIEEAEEIAALNLAKFRATQGNLADSGERADINEQALAKMKAKVRSGSVGL